MSLGFLIQNGVFEEDQLILKKVLWENNIPGIVHEKTDFCPNILPEYNSFNIFSIIGQEQVDKVFCYGSLEWIFQIQEKNDTKYCTMCSINNYDCRKYYEYYKKENRLFNEDYKIRAVDHFLRYWDGKPVFIRPCVGYKPGGFCGGVYSGKDATYIKSCLEDYEDILIAPVKHIDYEYRFIVKNNKYGYITGCQYKSYCPETKKLGFDPSPNIPFEVIEKFCEDILQKLEWHPDPIYVIDIVKSNLELSIMEINALSTSGWYDCDYDKIVKEIIKHYGN